MLAAKHRSPLSRAGSPHPPTDVSARASPSRPGPGSPGPAAPTWAHSEAEPERAVPPELPSGPGPRVLLGLAKLEPATRLADPDLTWRLAAEGLGLSHPLSWPQALARGEEEARETQTARPPQLPDCPINKVGSELPPPGKGRAESRAAELCMTSESRACPPPLAPPLPLPPPTGSRTPGRAGCSAGKGETAPPPVPAPARTSPAEPYICIPLRLPRTWGGIKGKVARACLSKRLWTETEAESGGGHAGAGRRPRKGRSWAPRPPLELGARHGPRFGQRSGPGAARRRETPRRPAREAAERL